MRFSLSTQFNLVIAAFAACNMLLALLAIATSSTLVNDTSTLKREANALYNQTMADMGHDALQSAVRGALLAALASDKPALDAARADFKESADLMRSRVAENLKLDLPAELQAHIRDSQRMVEDYIRTGEAVVAGAERGLAAAKAELQPFAAEFERVKRTFDRSGRSISEGFEVISANSEVTAQRFRITLFLGAIAMLLFCGLVAVAARVKVAKPLREAIAALDEAASGRTPRDLSDKGQAPEIGRLHVAIRTLASEVAKRVTLEEDAGIKEAQLAERRRLAEAASDFGRRSTVLSATLEQTTSKLGQVAQTLRQSVRVAEQGVTEAAAVGESTSASAASLATSLEQLLASTAEASAQIERTAGYAREAMSSSEQVDARVSALTASVARIGDATDIIRSIASQTNLLALNATIEAARAGEAGRGFAVVAAEVKALAVQTQTATEDIARHLQGVGETTRLTVEAIDGFRRRSAQISEDAVQIAGAITEQHQAMSQISAFAAGSVESSAQVTSALRHLSAASSETSRSAGGLESVIEELRRAEQEMSGAVRAFAAKAA